MKLWTAGLVDELHVVAGTGVAGGGTPVFPGSADVQLTTLETRLLPDSKCVPTAYAVGCDWLRGQFH